MAKRRRTTVGAPLQAHLSRASSPGKPALAKGLSKSPKPRLLVRIVASVLIPFLFLLALELVLRVAGYGYSTRFFKPIPGQQAFTTNPRFAWRFCPRETATQPYPIILPAQKAAGTKRVFILGESAAQGNPIPAFGFGRILEVLFQQTYPQEHVELLNVAMRGINSHAIVDIARECAEHQPDLFIIYMGNNETVGLHAPKPGGLGWRKPLWMLRAGQWFKDLKLGQLLADGIRVVRKPGPRDEQDMDFFRKYRLAADDPRRESVYSNFRGNLRDILKITQSSGAQVILCTVAGNLVDFPPLASLHNKRLSTTELAQWEQIYQQGVAAEDARKFSDAITNFLQAARLDDHFAELHFRLGQCYWALEQMADARKHFELARDWDALQFRTDQRLNDIVKQMAQGAKQVSLVDAQDIFATHEMTGNYLAEKGLFHEHVHLTFDGDYLLATTIYPVTAKLTLGKTSSPALLPTRDQCAAALAYTGWDELSVGSIVAQMTAKPPFLDQLEHAGRQFQAERRLESRNKLLQEQGGLGRAIEQYTAALSRRPDDWQMHMNFGMLLGRVKDTQGSVRELGEAVKLMPVYASLRVLYAQALFNAKRKEDARKELLETLRLEPGFPAAKAGLAAIGS